MAIGKRLYPILLGDKGELDAVETDNTIRNAWMAVFALQEDVTLIQEKVGGAIRRGEIAADDDDASVSKVAESTRTTIVNAPASITGAKLVNPISRRLPFVNATLELDGGVNAPEYNPSTKALTIRGALNISGASALTGAVTMASTLDVTGQITAEADLQVDGNFVLDGTAALAGTLTVQGVTIFDLTATEAFLVRVNSDGGDVFTVNTSTPGAIVGGTFSVSGTSLLSGTTTTFGRIKTIRRGVEQLTILVTDSVIFCNTDSAGFTATLPAGVSGQTFKVINSGSSGNLLTVAPNGSEHLLGVNSNFSLFDAETLDLTYDSTDGWY